jgi:glutamyl endopeptidase
VIESASNIDMIVLPKSISDYSGGKSAAPLAALGWKVASAFATLNKKLVATTKSQIGNTDDRTPVFNTRKSPFRMICALELDFGPGFEKFHGTGWLAGPSTIVTAGHCMFDFDANMGWVQTVTIDPGRNGDGPGARPFGTSKAKRFSVPRKWETSADPAFDIGCIHLDQPLGSTLGWLPFGATEAEFSKPQDLRSAGYSDYFAKNSIPLESAGSSVGVAQGRLFYTLDTERGASGAPVMPKTDPPRAIAIHAYNEDQQVSEIMVESNSGPLLGSEMVELINRWNAAH